MLDKHFRLSKTTKTLMRSVVNHERNHIFKKLMIQAEAAKSRMKVVISKPVEGDQYVNVC